jgi:hypothetical protein
MKRNIVDPCLVFRKVVLTTKSRSIFVLFARLYNTMVLIELALGLGTIILLWNVLASFIWSVVCLKFTLKEII